MSDNVQTELEEELPPVQIKQWVSIPGGSIALRSGAGVLSNFGTELRTAVGRPHRCAFLVSNQADEDLAELLRRDLTTIGFLVTRVDVEDGKAATTVATEAQVLSALAEMHLTADDLVVAVGHEGVISLANHVANKWCGGVSLATVPLDLAAVIVSSITPRALDTDAEHQRLVTTKPCARFCFADLEVMDLCDDNAKVAQVCMVATAMSDNEAEFGRIWDRADNLSSGVADIVAEQLAESTKTRGRLSDSSAIAIQQSVPYGWIFVEALRPLIPADQPLSALYADALRFSARIAVAKDSLSFDDMLAQDEILERLNIGFVTCDITSEQLIEALKQECFHSTNRFMLPIPMSIGRVRLASVDEELLAEHARAWCEAHASH